MTPRNSQNSFSTTERSIIPWKILKTFIVILRNLEAITLEISQRLGSNIPQDFEISKIYIQDSI